MTVRVSRDTSTIAADGRAPLSAKVLFDEVVCAAWGDAGTKQFPPRTCHQFNCLPGDYRSDCINERSPNPDVTTGGLQGVQDKFGAHETRRGRGVDDRDRRGLVGNLGLPQGS